MKDRLYQGTQAFSRSIIRPVMFMAVTGILVSIAAIMKLEQMPRLLQDIGNFFFTVLSNGNIGQLSVIFCVGITVAVAKKKKTDAAIIGISTFLMFIYANNFWLDYTGRLAEAGEQGLFGTGQGIVLGVQITDMGVFLGILLGFINGWIFNKLCDKKLNKYLTPYEGTKFAYLVLFFVTLLIAIAVTYIWPPINSVVNNLVELIGKMGAPGFFLYGFSNRMLLPLGLHHLLWMPLFYTPLGGVADVAGNTVYGAYNIWLAELGNISSISSIHPSVGYLVNFGCTALPIGIALALIKTAKKENKLAVKAIVIPLVTTALLAGITEPIEFLFLFLSPILWLVHAVVYGFGLFLASVFNIHIPIDSIITLGMNAAVVPGKLGNQIMIPIVFLILLGVEYFAFKFIITKFDLPTLGRRERLEGAESSLDTTGEVKTSDTIPLEAAKDDVVTIIEGLGGIENIREVKNCYTRLRIDVFSDDAVDEEILKKVKSSGIIRKNNHVQIVIGPRVEDLREQVDNYLQQLGWKSKSN